LKETLDKALSMRHAKPAKKFPKTVAGIEYDEWALEAAKAGETDKSQFEELLRAGCLRKNLRQRQR
jgi:hypothetical protein